MWAYWICLPGWDPGLLGEQWAGLVVLEPTCLSALLSLRKWLVAQRVCKEG